MKRLPKLTSSGKEYAEKNSSLSYTEYVKYINNQFDLSGCTEAYKIMWENDMFIKLKSNIRFWNMQGKLEASKVWPSMKEYFSEINSKYNPTIPAHIIDFWCAIQNFADCSRELGGEGNSGEFHNEKEEIKLGKELVASEKLLIEEFAKSTGYRPKYKTINEYIKVKYPNSDKHGQVYINGFYIF
jgi:hypothetical protein